MPGLRAGTSAGGAQEKWASALFGRKRQDHRYSLAIANIRLAVERDEVTLFQHDPDEQVPGGGDREQQVTRRHRRRRPERQQEAEIDGMADDLVEERRPEARMLEFLAAPARVDLVQPEQLEVIDQECADQYHDPAEPEDRPQGRGAHGVADRPDRPRDRSPLPEEQDERQARQQHVGAALHQPRHVLRPPSLEGLSRHDAVLYREYAK